MSAEEKRNDDARSEQSEIRRPFPGQHPGHTLAVPKLLQSEIREGKLHESRPALGSELELKRRPILSHRTGPDSAESEPVEGSEEGIVGASSTSEPPPEMGQALPLPEALRAAAQSSGAAIPSVGNASTSSLGGGKSRLRALKSGAKVGEYEIIRSLRAMGRRSTYLARDLQMGRRVVLEMIGVRDGVDLADLLAEGASLSRVAHENLAKFYEMGAFDGGLYVATEYGSGQGLSEYRTSHPRAIAVAVEMMASVTRGLARAHRQGIFHGDLDIDKILITDAGVVKVLELGLARIRARAAGEVDSLPIDYSLDVRSVGCILFELLAGVNPLAVSPEPLVSGLVPGGKIPSALSDIIERCLENDPQRKFADPGRLASELEFWLAEYRPGPETLRAREVAVLSARLRQTPLMAVLGHAQVGKSAFLEQSFIPCLEASGDPWSVVFCRLGRSPFLSIAEQLASDYELTPAVLAERLKRRPGLLGSLFRERCLRDQCRLVLVVDQFEVLYTQGVGIEERRCLMRAIMGAADDTSSPVRVVISMRAGFLGSIAEEAEFAAAVAHGLMVLAPSESESAGRELRSVPLQDPSWPGKTHRGRFDGLVTWVLLAGLLGALVGLYSVNEQRKRADHSALIAKKKAVLAQSKLEAHLRADAQRKKADVQRRAARIKAGDSL